MNICLCTYNLQYENWDSNDTNKETWNNTTTNNEIYEATANKECQPSLINITLGTMKNCEVVFTNSPLDFFVQLQDDIELEPMMETIATTYENGGEIMPTSEMHCGTYCIAQYAEDLTWYRALIKSVEENNVTVQFIDYGNIETVDFTKIKVIQDEFLKLHIQAIHCKLLGYADMDLKEKSTIFTENVEEKLLQAEFVAVENGIYDVLLHEIIDGTPKTNSINEELCIGIDLSKAKEIAINKKTAKTELLTPDYASFDSKWQTILYEPESNHDVIITWFINPNKFYCQVLNKEAEFKAMMNDIQSTYINRDFIAQKLQVSNSLIIITN